MHRAADRPLDVELVEDLPDEPSGHGARGRDRSARARVASVPRRVRLAVAVLAAAGIGAVSVADRLEDSALDARLAAVDGLSTPLDRPLTAAWRVPGSAVLAGVGDVVVVRGEEGDGTVVVDRADGRVRYALEGTCQLVPVGLDAGSLAFRNVVVTGDDDDLLLCVDEAAADGLPATAASATARVHAPGTGEVLRSFPLGAMPSWTVLGDDVVALGVAADGHVVAARWSLSAGTTEWTFRSAGPVPRVPDGWSATMSETVVGVDSEGWSLALDPATGTEVDAATLGTAGGLGVWGPVDGPGGTTLEGRYSADGRNLTTVRDAAGTRRFTTPGLALTPGVDDGTLPGLLLLVETTDDPEDWGLLHGVDVVTGENRWTVSRPVGHTLVLSGTVVLRDGSGVTAVDGRTGRTRWSTGDGTPSTAGWDVVTDGRRVLTVDRTRTPQALLVQDLATGAPVWTVPAPVDDASVVQLDDGTVLLLGSGEVVALRR